MKMTTTTPRIRLLANALPAALLILAPSHASATITTSPPSADLSAPVLMPSVDAFAVTGAQMDNRLSITATFMSLTGGPITETRPWLLDGGVFEGGHAVGSFWSLEQSGDTFNNPWTLTVHQGLLLKDLHFVFDSIATGQGVVLDRTVTTGDGVGTPGSSTGKDFLVIGNTPGPLDAWTAQPKYSRPGDVPTDAIPGAFGDIFGQLDVAFDGPRFFTTAPYQVEFMQDCDIATIPTPGALALVSVSGLAVLRRRRG